MVEAALQIVVDDGVSKLTMRRLGSRLGMDPMVPYRFFDTKDDLLEAVFVQFLTSIGSLEDSDPVRKVEQGFREFRRTLVDIPALVALVGPRLRNTPAALWSAAWVVQQLTGAGMSAADAMRWNAMLLSYVVGSLSFAPEPGSPPIKLDTGDLPADMAQAISDAGEIDLEEYFEWGFQRCLEQLRLDLKSVRG